MKNFIDWVMTPAHLTLILLVCHTFLKGFHDAWDANKDRKGADKTVAVILDTLLYVTAGR